MTAAEHDPTGPAGAPRRILVIGSGGAGKSTFARALGRVSGLPVVHLDALYWRPGWVEPDPAAWADQLEPVLAEPAWIVDGNYGGTMKQRARAAELVVLLDPSRWRCLARVARRAWRYRGRVRPDMGAGCEEHLTVEFVGYVLRYPRASLPKALRRVGEAGHDELVVLRRRREIDAFLDGWPASARSARVTLRSHPSAR